MKVYIICEKRYEDYFIRAVFNVKSNAIEYCNHNLPGLLGKSLESNAAAVIEEWETT